MKAKKWFFAVLVGAMALSMAPLFDFGAQAAQIGTISNLTIAAADRTPSATTTYTLTFTSSVEIPQSGGFVTFQLYGPYATGASNTSVNFNSATLAGTTSPSSLSISSYNWNGLTLKTSSVIPAGTAVSVVVNNVVNPSTSGYYVAHLWTHNYSTDIDGSSMWGGDYNSPYLEIGTNTNVTGTITDASGNPVPFTTVYIYTSDWSRYYSSYSDKNGAYGFGDVVSGSYTLDIYASAGYGSGKSYFPPAKSTITVASSGVTTKNVSFVATTKTLSGKVTKNSESGTAITNAQVYASRAGGSGYVSTNVDSTGSYSFALPGGTWTIGVYPTTYPADWVYTVYNETVSFTDDSSAETKTKNFVATALNSTVTGTVTYPDGSKPTSQWGIGVSFSSTSGQYFYGQMDTNGGFSAKVSEGTYSVSGWVSESQYSFPKVDNFTIQADESKNIGTLKLVEKTDSISGKVSDNNGAAVSGAYISAWKSEGGYDYGYATSASDGTYTIKVVPGTYSVSAWPQWNSGYVYSGKPSSVSVTSGVVATKNFTFQKATNKLKVTVTDPDGNVLTSLYPWVSASDGSTEWGNVGTSLSQGVGEMMLPSGTWDIKAYIYGSDYGSPDPEKVTFSGDNETKSLTLKAVKNNSTINGTVYDETGSKVTGQWMSIYATKGKNGSWQSASFDQSNATYSIKVSSGTWNLGYWIDQALGYSSGNGQDIEIAIASNETHTYDITLKKANATIGGKAKKANGDAMVGAWITADSRDPNEKKSANTYYYGNGTSSNSSGDFSLKVPAGTYFVGANMWPGSGYINPKRQKITVEADKSASLDLTFRTADATISGTVKKDGSGTDAYTTAWAEDGGYSETNSNNSGAYELSVSKGTKWHIKAQQQVGNDVYKSKEVIVDLSESTSATQDLELAKLNFTVPDGQTVTFDPTKAQSIALEDGTTVSIPANAMATSGTVTVTIEPDATLAEEADAKPLSYGYEMNATDQNGKEITTFNSNITIESKYTDAVLEDSTVQDEQELIIGYYDTAAATWVELPNCTKSDDENTVTCQTNHFTTYAIVAATDTTPPAAPSGISATSGDGKVTLVWTKPTDADFSSISIYRSTVSGTIGDTITSANTSTSHIDTGLTNGTTYYYTIRAVDSSGNESTNTAQVSSKPSATGSVVTTLSGKGLAKTGTPSVFGLGLLLISAACLVVMHKTKNTATRE